MAVVGGIYCVAQSLGYPSLRPYQHQVIENIMKGRDVFAILPTGLLIIYELFPDLFHSLSSICCVHTAPITCINVTIPTAKAKVTLHRVITCKQ